MSFVVSDSSRNAYNQGQFNRTPEKRWEPPQPESNTGYTSAGDPGEDAPANVDLGGWTADNVMQFVVDKVKGSIVKIYVDEASPNSVGVLVKMGVIDDNPVYQEIQTGTDSRSTDWYIDFNIYYTIDPETEYQGRWKFTKSKGSDDIDE